MTSTTIDSGKLVTELDMESANFYFTYIKPKERQKKIVLKTAPNMQVQQIVEEMEQKVTRYIPMKGKLQPQTLTWL